MSGKFNILLTQPVFLYILNDMEGGESCKSYKEALASEKDDKRTRTGILSTSRPAL